MLRPAGPLATARRVVLGAATAAAAFHLARVVLAYAGTTADRIELVFALKLVLVPALALHWAWRGDALPAPFSARLTAACERHATALVLALVAVTDVVVFLTTPQIGFGVGSLGPGYGHDGIWYGWMAEKFGWFRHVAPGNFAYRWLPSLLVHYSGLDTFTGFMLLDLASHALATLLVYRVALHFTSARADAVLAAALFTSLKFGVKFLRYYPVLTDGLGLALLMLVVWATLERRYVVYVAAMTCAVVCRENVLALTGFNALYLIRTGRGHARWAGAALLQVLPWAAFVLSRRVPVFGPVDAAGALTIAWEGLATFAVDPRRQQAAVLAYVNSLGVLAILPLLWWRQTAELLAERYEWAAYVAVNVVLSVAGGADVDRFAVWLAPFAVVAVTALRSSSPPSRRWWYLVLVQATAMELFLPWFPEEQFYLSRTAAHATDVPLAHMALFSWMLAAVVLALEVDDPAPLRSSG